MKEKKEKIEQIMQEFYEKQDEINKLINANAEEKAIAEAALKEAEQKRNAEKEEIIDKECDLSDQKELLLGQDIVDSDITINGILIPKPDEEEKKLIAKIEELNEKERKIVGLKNQLTNLKNSKEGLVSQCLMNIKEYSNEMNDSFEKTMIDFENELSSSINALTEEVSKKYLFERELEQIRLNKDRENFVLANKKINSLFVQKSLEQFFKSEEEKLANIRKELCNESQEEKELRRRIREIEGRPNLTIVYLREMFELKYDVKSSIVAEKVGIEMLLNSKKTEKQNIMNQVESEKADKVEELDNIKIELNKLADQIDQLNSLAKVDRENYTITNDEESQKLKAEYNKLGSKAKHLEELINNISVDTTELDTEISAIQEVLDEIDGYINALAMTPEESAAYSKPLNEIEQAEYNRRLIIRNQEKIAMQNKQKEIEDSKRLQLENQIEANRQKAEQLEAEEKRRLSKRKSKDDLVDQILSSNVSKVSQTTLYREPQTTTLPQLTEESVEKLDNIDITSDSLDESTVVLPEFVENSDMELDNTVMSDNLEEQTTFYSEPQTSEVAESSDIELQSDDDLQVMTPEIFKRKYFSSGIQEESKSVSTPEPSIKLYIEPEEKEKQKNELERIRKIFACPDDDMKPDFEECNLGDMLMVFKESDFKTINFEDSKPRGRRH